MNLIGDQIKGVLLGFPGIRLAILFGSQASGTSDSNSDIDLALLFDEPISDTLKIALIEDLATEFGRSIDIVDIFFCPEPIMGQVFKGERLIGDDALYAQCLTKHLINAADFLPIRERILRERREAWIG